MQRLPTLIFVLVISFQLFAQNEEEYPSSEETEYYKSRTFTPFKPVSKKIVKRYKPLGATIKKSPNRTNTFSSVWDLSPYQEIFSNLRDSCVSRARESEDWKFYSSCMRNIDSLEYSDKIGDISRSMILRVNSETNPSVILYLDGKFENRNLGYWIGVLNYGEWNYYYTGLTANHYLYIKPISTIDFQSSSNILKVEAAFVRLTEQGVLPSGPPEYELVKDNLILEFNLDAIKKDSDQDGLTDILESKLRTNPNNQDTDQDGIDDFNDNVPLSKKSTSDLIAVYNYLLNNPTDSCSTKGNDFSSCQTSNDESLFDQTYLIVSDEQVLKSVTSKSDRLIVLTSKEFEEYESVYPVSLERFYVSPMFKVDDKPNTYRITIGGTLWDHEYLIQKTDNGWKVILIGMTII